MKNLYELIVQKIPDAALGLAVIIRTGGSTPRDAGTSALFSPDGLIWGTLGGGQMEAEAGAVMSASLESGESRLLTFSMLGSGESDEPPCGGEAVVLIDVDLGQQIKAFRSAFQALKHRRIGVMETWIRGAGILPVSISRVWRQESETLKSSETDGDVSLYKEILRSGRPRLIPLKEGYRFLEPVFPHFRLLVVGAGHVGQAVSHLASLLDFEVTVLDDRPEYATRERFPDAESILVDRIADGVSSYRKDQETFIVIATRGHRQDAEALKACIRSPAAYLGMMGSVRKIRLMREKFLDSKAASADEFDRVFAPIGLDIHSKTVQEIAVSIAAQLVQVRSRLRGGAGKT